MSPTRRVSAARAAAPQETTPQRVTRSPTLPSRAAPHPDVPEPVLSIKPPAPPSSHQLKRSPTRSSRATAPSESTPTRRPSSPPSPQLRQRSLKKDASRDVVPAMEETNPEEDAMLEEELKQLLVGKDIEQLISEFLEGNEATKPKSSSQMLERIKSCTHLAHKQDYDDDEEEEEESSEEEEESDEDVTPVATPQRTPWDSGRPEERFRPKMNSTSVSDGPKTPVASPWLNRPESPKTPVVASAWKPSPWSNRPETPVAAPLSQRLDEERFRPAQNVPSPRIGPQAVQVSQSPLKTPGPTSQVRMIPVQVAESSSEESEEESSSEEEEVVVPPKKVVSAMNVQLRRPAGVENGLAGVPGEASDSSNPRRRFVYRGFKPPN